MQINGRLNLCVAGVVAGSMGWKGGKGTYTVESSNWNGATISLQVLSANGTWINVKDISGDVATASMNSMYQFDLPPGQIQIAISGAPTSAYAYAVGSHQ